MPAASITVGSQTYQAWANGSAQQAYIGDGPGGGNTIPSNVLFQDNFDGTGIVNGTAMTTYTATADSPPNPAYWMRYDGNGAEVRAESPTLAKNVTLNGNGQCRVSITREPQGVPNRAGVTKNFSCGFFGTWLYGGIGGWPPTQANKLVVATTPFRIEARFKWGVSRATGAVMTAGWGGMWMMETNTDVTQGVWELDIAENFGNALTKNSSFEHLWVNGSDVNSSGGNVTGISDTSQNWHVIRADVFTSGVKHYLDDVLYWTGPILVRGNGTTPASNQLGPMFDFGIRAGLTLPPASDPGPWDYLIDWFRITDL